MTLPTQSLGIVNLFPKTDLKSCKTKQEIVFMYRISIHCYAFMNSSIANHVSSIDHQKPPSSHSGNKVFTMWPTRTALIWCTGLIWCSNVIKFSSNAHIDLKPFSFYYKNITLS